MLQNRCLSDVTSLVVCDTAFDGSLLGLHYLGCKDALEEQLRELPAHEEGVARIFDHSANFRLDQIEQLQAFLTRTYDDANGISRFTSRDTSLAYDVDSIASQWTSDIPVCLEANGYAPQSSARCALRWLKSLPVKVNRLLSEYI